MPDDHAVEHVEVLPVHGIGELRPGDDLARVIAEHAPPLLDGDVLVVTSKAVSKAEGRLVILDVPDPDLRDQAREEAITAETVRLVARRGALRIVQTRHGLVLAAAGIDASNTPRNELVLLPLAPDDSAERLRRGIQERRGVDVAVIISDSMGRPWRHGIVDLAIGIAGITPVVDERGMLDPYGNTLTVTEVAIADEIAAAADLVKGKLSGIPVAIVRGLSRDGKLPDNGAGSAALIRPAEDDMFRLGTAEAIIVGREDVGGATDVPPRLHEDAVEVISVMTATTTAETSVREAFLAFLAARPDAMWRSCLAGHLTASAIVLDPRRRAVLLTLHPRVRKWLQLGGHCDAGDQTLLDAAAREAREESGIGALSFDPAPLGLDVYPITCSLGVPTRHFDVRFLAVAPEGAEPVRSAESLDLRWFGWDDLPDNTSGELAELIEVARLRLGT
jgi:coenzyme F420-0:L-glutamate ligase